MIDDDVELAPGELSAHDEDLQARMNASVAAAVEAPTLDELRAQAAELVRAEGLDAVRRVHALRERLAIATGARTALEQALYENAVYKMADATVKRLGDELAAADREARESGLIVYALDDSNKKPVAGVGIRDERSVRYDAAVALEWAKKDARLFVLPESLDRKALDKHLLARADDASPLGFDYSVDIAPKATLATDLDAALAKEAQDGAQ
jgi:hypothetical protein